MTLQNSGKTGTCTLETDGKVRETTKLIQIILW